MRTKKGNFGKVIGISNVTGRKTPKYLIKWTGEKAYYISQVKDVKHSKNIIDLIEVGDYVNGYKVSRIETGVIVVLDYFGFRRGIKIEEVKSIVTKEQFASMEYRLEV